MASLLEPTIGLRVDGRKPHELRRLECEMGVFAQADGSAIVSHGNTKVLATVYGPHEVSLSFFSLFLSLYFQFILNVFFLFLFLEQSWQIEKLSGQSHTQLPVQHGHF